MLKKKYTNTKQQNKHKKIKNLEHKNVEFKLSEIIKITYIQLIKYTLGA